MNSPFLENKMIHPKMERKLDKEGRIDTERQNERPAEAPSLSLPNQPPRPLAPSSRPRPCLGHPVGPRE